MTKDQVLTAINEGIPLVIKMADGEKYEVHEKHQVAVGRTSVVVLGEGDLPHILHLITMTGISYLASERK